MNRISFFCRERAARAVASDVVAAGSAAPPVAVPPAPLPSRRLYHTRSASITEYAKRRRLRRGFWITVRLAEAIVRKGGGRMGTQWGARWSRGAGAGPLAIRRLDKF